MKQPLFPSTICTQSDFAYFPTIKAVVRKFGKSDGQTGSRCLDKAVLAQGGGGGGGMLLVGSRAWFVVPKTHSGLPGMLVRRNPHQPQSLGHRFVHHDSTKCPTNSNTI